MDKKVKKLATLQKEPNLALFDELTELNERFEAIQEVLSEINLKEARTYEEELNALQEGISSLREAFDGKDMVVNIPLDDLADKIGKVELAIKNIKEVKMPEFPEMPNEMALPNGQIEELKMAIDEIPEFPFDELRKLFLNVETAIREIRFEAQPFDYELLEDNFKMIKKAIEGISISVSGGGGGIGEDARQDLDTIATNTTSLSSKSDPLAKYKFADLDDDASPNYYGATDVDGNWYILREDTSAKTLRYATGNANYATNWNNRLALTYDYIFNCTIY